MSSPSQTPSSNSPPVPLDQDWIEDELVPFLQRVFEGEKRTPREWNRQVLYARHNLDRIAFYEDFPYTIERLRLTLLNSEYLTPAEIAKYIHVAEEGSQFCIRIFVRHAVRYGVYRLFSLGQGPSPEFPRPAPSGTGQTAAPAAAPAPAPAPAQTSTPSLAQLEDRNATLERQLAALNVRVDRAEGTRGGGRGNGCGRGYPPRGRSSRGRGEHVGRSDRGGRFNQGSGVAPAVQQTPAQVTSNPPEGYYQPYPNPQYGYGGPYMPGIPMGTAYPMQPYQQQPFTNPGQQYDGGWTGTQMTYTTHQAESSQTGASSGFAMPPQQVGSANPRGQAGQRPRGSSRTQQGQGQAPTRGLSAPPQQRSSSSRTSTHVPRPDAKEFYPGSGTKDD